MIWNKKQMIVFFSIAFLTILITNILTKSNNEIPQIKVLGFSDALHIFLINTLNILIFLLFSITGITFIIIFRIFIIIGQGPSLSGINPLIYYFCSFAHGLGELIACALVFCFSISQFKIIFGYFIGKVSKQEVKNLYISLFKYTLPSIIITLFISSLLEVYVSNRLIIYFVNNFYK